MGGLEGFGIDSADRTPVYAQLERGIRSAMAAVAKVYAFLEREGVLETRRGVGTFIAARTPSRQEDSLRRADLHRLVERFLADLSSHGFRVEDALPAIESRRQQGA